MAAIALLVPGVMLVTGASRAESPGSAFSESSYKVARRFVYPEQFKAGKAYSPGVLAGDTLYIAGQVSLDPQTGQQPEGFDAQAKLAMDNMGHVLRAAGMDFANLVTCHVYLADIASYKAMNAVYGSYFEAGSAPARTTLEMPGLPGGSQIEVSCIAFADRSRIRIVEPPEGATPENKIPISPAVWAGDRLYLSGFGGRHPVSNKFDDTMEGQTRRAMENVAGTLKAEIAGAYCVFPSASTARATILMAWAATRRFPESRWSKVMSFVLSRARRSILRVSAQPFTRGFDGVDRYHLPSLYAYPGAWREPEL